MKEGRQPAEARRRWLACDGEPAAAVFGGGKKLRTVAQVREGGKSGDHLRTALRIWDFVLGLAGKVFEELQGMRIFKE